jgi:hypothetical protein
MNGQSVILETVSFSLAPDKMDRREYFIISNLRCFANKARITYNLKWMEHVLLIFPNQECHL